jgi:DNA repair exonuclease SbcCD ATPase subunit
MAIIFKTVRYKNFLSTGGQFTEIKLDKSPTTLIVGENGAGKSTILDAICFALFGKPFRNVNKPQLMNSINNKQLLVEIEFSIGSKDYLIRRGIKPAIFEIMLGKDLVNQDAASRDYQKYLEDQILKLNYKSFTQIVILGSASFTPFMQLTTSNRREIIEDILDIQIFSIMNDLLKNNLSEIKDNLKSVTSTIELTKQKVVLQHDYIKKLEETKQKQQDNVQGIIDITLADINRISTLIDEKQVEHDNFELLIVDEPEQQTKQAQVSNLLKKLADRILTAKDSIEFYHGNDACPTCNQELDPNHKNHTITKHENKIVEISTAIDDLTLQLNAIEVRLNEIKDIKKTISAIATEIIKYNNEIIGAQSYIKKLKNEAAVVEVDTLTEEKSKLKTMAKEVVELTKQKAVLTEDKFYHETAGLLLKDTGIKTKIIKQYLPIINKLINKYLAAMDFFCHFEFDESFNETIKSRHRDSFTYASFSEGEKQRIDLALLFTWRTIAKSKNSANANLLLLDEIFDSSLDSNGTDYVMNLLNTIGSDTNVFVISHKGDQLFDKFRSTIKFEKHQNFSRIAS